MTPQQFLDKGLADAKPGGNGPLGAELLGTGTEDLVSKIKGISFHASQHSASMPYIQLQTAIGVTLIHDWDRFSTMGRSEEASMLGAPPGAAFSYQETRFAPDHTDLDEHWQ
jgi:hypothetical protein